MARTHYFPAFLIIFGAGLVSQLACKDAAPEDSGNDSEDDSPTYHQDVAPIIAARCSQCHYGSGVAPFPLDTYEETRVYASWMTDLVASQNMPPWTAWESDDCTPEHTWLDDIRMTGEEIFTLVGWAQDYAPEGDPDNPSPLPTLVDTTMATVDTVIQADAPWEIPHDPEDPEDVFRCTMFDPGLEETQWISATQIQNGNEGHLQSAMAFIIPTQHVATYEALLDKDAGYSCPTVPQEDDIQLINIWMPGQTPMEVPEGAGIRLDPEARVLLRTHFRLRTEDDPGTDQTGLQVDWTNGAPDHEAVILMMGNAEGAPELQPGPHDPGDDPSFFIPATSVHSEEMHFEAPEDKGRRKVWALGNWMHHVGASASISIQRPSPENGEPTQECLLGTDLWDMVFPRLYQVDSDDLPTWGQGDTLVLTCTYVNEFPNESLLHLLEANGYDRPIDITLGEGELDENCLALVGLVSE